MLDRVAGGAMGRGFNSLGLIIQDLTPRIPGRIMTSWRDTEERVMGEDLQLPEAVARSQLD